MDDRVTRVARDPFVAFTESALGGPLRAKRVETVQVNIGLACNLACAHCHVESSPTRRERMDWQTMLSVLDAARRTGARVLDVTGGAPEMHPRFRDFVTAGRALCLDIIVRTNLTILLRPGFADLPQFFRERRVHLIASLPCYLEKNVDRQRGDHVYRDSIEAIHRLNAVGYGRDPELRLDLAYNPGGPALPPRQADLEAVYRDRLRTDHGIEFSHLLALANVPIGRFRQELQAAGRAEEYAHALREAANPATVAGLMCRSQIHVAHDGALHDCDFNYAEGIPLDDIEHSTIERIDAASISARRIATGPHCFACTAGSGSSCGGALT